MNNNGVCVGIPWAGPPAWWLLESLLHLQSPDGWRLIRNPKPWAVDVARNYIARAFLTDEAYQTSDWLLWVDADAWLHPMTLVRLLSWERPIVGALSFTKGVPIMPTVYGEKVPDEDDKWLNRVHDVGQWFEERPNLITRRPNVVQHRTDDSLIEAEGFTGCHCLLVHRMVLEAIEPPWFVADEAKGEDRYFCQKAIAAGYKIYVDLGVWTGHVFGERPLGLPDFMAWYKSGAFMMPEEG